jgi:hypothetical protein
MAGRPPFPTSSAATPDSVPPLPLSYRAALTVPGSARAPVLVTAAAPPPPPGAPVAPQQAPAELASPPASAPPSSTSLPTPTPAAAALHPGFPSSAISLPDTSLLHSQLLASGFPHVPLDMPVGPPVRDRPPPLTVYSQPSAITSSLHTPSDDAAALLVATWATVTAARQHAQDVARALEHEQAVVDAIERQYAETYHHLIGKGVSDASPMTARYYADTFKPAATPTSTLRASLHAQAMALTSIRATVTANPHSVPSVA